ncbi:unnamed protein product [Rotaria sp. Silwood2]|nr:unnamed protein product [Rotaria sp. Silwood2]
MSERKRQKRNNDNEKKSITITKFEQFPNELLLICFDYFDYYGLCQSFFGLNQRFDQLITYESKIHMDLESIPEQYFLTYCIQFHHLVMKSGKFPLSFQTNDQYRLDLMFADYFFKDKFSKLKSLTLQNIKVDSVYEFIFDKDTKLYENLQRINLMNIECEKSNSANLLTYNLISPKMKSLTYLNMNFQPCSPCKCGYNNGMM